MGLRPRDCTNVRTVRSPGNRIAVQSDRGITGGSMSTVATANLVGITGIARRLVLDGVLEDTIARQALANATGQKQPIAAYLAEKRLVTPAQLAAANSIE